MTEPENEGKHNLQKESKRKWTFGTLAAEYGEKKVDEFFLKILIFVFIGSGFAVGYPLFHPQLLKPYWYLPVIGLLVALTGGYVVLQLKAKNGGLQSVGWVIGLLMTFGVGVYVSAIVR